MTRRWFVILISLLVFALPATPASNEDERLDFEKLLDLINTNKIETIEDLYANLPVSFKENYVLADNPRGTQIGSKGSPRLISFNRDATFIIAFPGADTEGRRAQRVEISLFDGARRTFELRELRFQSGRAELSQANPTTCIGCHTADPRPNWEPYFLWPGIVGSVDDQVSKELALHQPKLVLPETVSFVNLFSNRNKDPLLKNLLPQKSEVGGVYKVVDIKSGEQMGGTEGVEAIGPNARFGHLLSRLNSQRIGRKLSSLSFRSYRYALLGSMFCSSYSIDGKTHPFPISSFFPPAVFHQLSQRSSPERIAAAIQRESLRAKEKNLRIIAGEIGRKSLEDIGGRIQIKWDGNNPSIDGTYNGVISMAILRILAEMRWMVESAGGDMADWSMSFTGDPDLNDGANLVSKLQRAALQEFMKDDRELSNLTSGFLEQDTGKLDKAIFPAPGDSPSLREFCDYLKRKSLLEFTVTNDSPIPEARHSNTTASGNVTNSTTNRGSNGLGRASNHEVGKP